MQYEDLDFKIPIQSDDYEECSDFVVNSIEAIIKEAIDQGKNKIYINTNLRFGLPMENINKVAGPFVEAWAFETFHDALNDGNNKYQLINVEAQERLYMTDIILQFRKQRKVESGVTAEVDVKATAEDIESSGKSPNITSFGRIRTAYVENPDYIFVILSLKHRVYSTRNKDTRLMDGVMEVVAYNAYDLKYLSSKDLNYNPALGTGQIQVKDIHYVSIKKRTTWEFCQFLHRKFLSSSRRSLEQRIILGDAIEKLADFPDESFDLIIADAPYNLGKDYGNNHDIKGFEEYLYFSRQWTKGCYRVLKSTGTLYVFMGFRFISYLYDILERELGMYFNSWIVWHYTQGMGKTKGFSPRHDDILMFTKGCQFTFNLNEVRVPQKYYRERNNMRGANPGDVWEFSHVHYCNGNRQNHPTQKPEGLIERMVLASSNEGDHVLDLFSGSGTTLRVCQQLSRNCIGIEINPDYVEMTKKRLQSEFLGFDSVDPRMERVPFDLRRREVREEYLENHKNWFLKNHQNAVQQFEESVREVYGLSNGKEGQLRLFESRRKYNAQQVTALDADKPCR